MEYEQRFTLEKLNEMSDKKILDNLFNSLVLMKDVRFIENPDHESGARIVKPAFDKIRRKFVYVEEPFEYLMNVPVIDETKRERYKRKVFLKTKNDIIPEKGFFVKVYPRLTVKPLGLVEVAIWGGKLQRMDKDFKNLPPVKVFERTEYMLYDFSEYKFRAVDTDEYERVKFGLSKGKDLDDLLEKADETAAKLIRVYLQREELLEASQERINPYAESLQDTYLDLFKDDSYNKKLVDGTLINNPKVATSDVQDYLVRYKKKVTDSIFDWLKIKLVFSTINMIEYDKIREHLLDNVRLVEGYIADLIKLEDPKAIAWNQAGIVDQWDKEGMLVAKIKKGIAQIQKVNIPRPFAFNKQLPMDGYIGYDLEKNELYPNLAELENRRYLKEEFSSIFEDEKYKDLVLDSLREK